MYGTTVLPIRLVRLQSYLFENCSEMKQLLNLEYVYFRFDMISKMIKHVCLITISNYLLLNLANRDFFGFNLCVINQQLRNCIFYYVPTFPLNS